MNLLPAHRREKIELLRQGRCWAAGALLLTLLLLMLSWFNRQDLLLARQQLNSQQIRLNRLNSMDQTLTEVLTQNETLQARQMEICWAAYNGHIFRSILEALSTAKHEDDWLTLIADEQSYYGHFETMPISMPAPDMALAAGPGHRIQRIIVEGYTPQADLSSVLGMIESLRVHPAVDEADLLPDDVVRARSGPDAPWEKTGATPFAVEIAVPKP